MAKHTRGFTLVELLIVIVVIAILAAITIVAYRGIQDRAKESTIKSDLSQAAKQLALDKTLADSYPSTVNQDGSGDANGGKGIPKGSTKYEYSVNNTTGTFCLSGVNGNKAYHIVNGGIPEDGVCPGHSGPGGSGEGGGGGSLPFDTVIIGSQTWAKTNLNVGTMVSGSSSQTDNSIVEKYCYNDDEANCTANGGLYQWNETMQYATAEGAQGICPAGWHIPTDNDWKTLEVALGMTQVQADATGWRGTDQAAQLRFGGTSGLDIPIAGYRIGTGSYSNLGHYGILWSSSKSGSDIWTRTLYSGESLNTVARFVYSNPYGLSVRCLAN